MSSRTIIGFPHSPQPHGGPGSFQLRLEKQLKALGWKVVYPEDDVIPDVILVVGGTKKLKWLKKCKKQGTKIVHRLDGMNWHHKAMPTPFKIKALAIIRNWLFKTIRKKIANEVIYQSHFIQECWHKFGGRISTSEHIIYNAVDLANYHPAKLDKPDLVCVEGTIQPHKATIEPLKKVAAYLKEKDFINKVIVCGSIEEGLRNELETLDCFEVRGCVKREEIPSILSGNLFMVLEINPPCPNSVIEALASGCPVIGFDSGSLKNLVKEGAGLIVDYGGDSWKMDIPNAQNLIDRIDPVMNNFEQYSAAARKCAEDNNDIETMTQKYIEVLKLK